jgi:hypothetical protein
MQKQPEYSVNLKQLNDIQSDLASARQASYAATHAWYASIIVFTFCVIVASVLVAVFNAQFVRSLYFGGFVVMSSFVTILVVLYLLRGKTCEAVILEKLTNYVPFNVAAYDCLREQVRQKGDLANDDLMHWISTERSSLFNRHESHAMDAFLKV